MVTKMHGKIISYDSETEIGMIRGQDNNTYTMSAVDCRSVILVTLGAEVNFEPHADKATEIYVISSAVISSKTHIAEHHHSKKKPTKTYLREVIIGSLVIFIGILIYGELDRRKMDEIQTVYHEQIKNIEVLLINRNCIQAQKIYLEAQITREKIFKMGLYYTLDSHAKQAHAIEIAECFADKNEFDKATSILEIKTIHDPDYLFRASQIYKNANNTQMAAQAKAMAQKYDTKMN
jgi:hypothetical protein